jgi:hypothetical protein
MTDVNATVDTGGTAGDGPVGLAAVDLPAAFRAADAVAVSSQRRAMRWTAWQLALLVLAAAASAITAESKIGHRDFVLGGFLSFVLFAGALLFSMLLATEAPSEGWYHARVSAELVKTLAWRFAVGGDPFPITLAERDADLAFEQHLENVNLGEIDWPSGSQGEQITPRMRELRGSNLATRMRAYRRGRIEDQRDWYSSRATRNGRRARHWRSAEIFANFAGLLVAALRMADIGKIDLLAVAATFATAAAAWTQTKQFKNLSLSYSAAAHDLSLIAIRLDHVDTEAEWAAFVDVSERDISREHQHWVTRHNDR